MHKITETTVRKACFILPHTVEVAEKKLMEWSESKENTHGKLKFIEFWYDHDSYRPSVCGIWEKKDDSNI